MTATLPQFLRFGELLRAPGGDFVKARMLVAHLIADADGGDTIYPTPMWAESVSSFMFILAFILRLWRCPAVINALHSHIVGGYEFDDGATYFASARCTGCTNLLLLWPVRTLHYSCWSGAVFAPMLATPACVRAPISSFADSERDGSGALRERYARHARVHHVRAYVSSFHTSSELALAISVRTMLTAPGRVRATISSFADSRCTGLGYVRHTSCVRATISGFATSSVSWPWRSPCAPCSSHLRVCEHLFPASLIRA